MSPRPAAAALALALLAAGAAHAQDTPISPADPPMETEEPAEATDTLDAEVSVSPVLFAPVFWSPSAGFGLGLGANVSNLGRPGASLLVQVAPAQYRGSYGAWYQTRPPYGPGPSLFGGAFYEADGRYTTFGLGPTSDRDDEVALDRRLMEVEARASVGLGDRGRLRPQGWARWQTHRIRRARDLEDGARSRLDPVSAAAVDASVGADPSVFTVGADLIYDTRANLYNPPNGVLLQAGVMQHLRTGGRFDGYNQRQLGASVYVPLTDDMTASLRAYVVDSDAPATTPLVVLPILDGDIGPGMARHRFTAPDFAFVSLDVTRPIFDLFGFFAMDAVATVAAFNAYDDIARDFSPAFSFDRTFAATTDRVPLRPAAAFGLRFHSGYLESTLLNLSVHASADGFGLATFGITTDARAPRPLLRAR